MLSDIHSRVNTTLTNAGINPENVIGLDSLFDQQSSTYVAPFSGLETQYMQLKYYKERFSFVVSQVI